MRWYWIDRFIEFESGRYAKAIKNVSLAEDHLHDHFPAYPVMPNSLVIEGLAQTGGLLVSEYHQFATKVVLAKVAKVKFYCDATPGDSLIYTTTIESISAQGARVHAASHKDSVLHAEAEIVFAHLNDPNQGLLFNPETFLQMLRLLGAFRVGRAADGSPLRPPKHLIDAEAASDAQKNGEHS